jgi:metal-dependent HD superfamily phosphatase/phosphodiesterase
MKRFESLRRDPEILGLVDAADRTLGAMNYTDHGRRHVTLVAVNGAKLLGELKSDERLQELAAVAGLLHDIGNVVGRNTHAAAGAVMAYPLLVARGFSVEDAAEVVAAIGNHDETERGVPVNAVCAALIIADKADIHRSRVRTRDPEAFDVHDRVNHAVTKAELETDAVRKQISLRLSADFAFADQLEIADIFALRFALSDAAARLLGCTYTVTINGAHLT